MEALQQLRNGVSTIQEYWFVVTLALVWFARNAIRGWIESQLKIEVNARAKAVEAEVLTKLELLKASLSSDMEELKIKIEVRKAVALQLAQKRIVAFVETAKDVDAAGSDVCSYLALERNMRVNDMGTSALIDRLHEWMLREREHEIFRSIELNVEITGYRVRLLEIVNGFRAGEIAEDRRLAVREEVIQHSARLGFQVRTALEELSESAA